MFCGDSIGLVGLGAQIEIALSDHTLIAAFGEQGEGEDEIKTGHGAE